MTGSELEEENELLRAKVGLEARDVLECLECGAKQLSGRLGLGACCEECGKVGVLS